MGKEQRTWPKPGGGDHTSFRTRDDPALNGSLPPGCISVSLDMQKELSMNDRFLLSEGTDAKDNLAATVAARLGVEEAASAEPMIRKRAAQPQTQQQVADTDASQNAFAAKDGHQTEQRERTT